MIHYVRQDDDTWILSESHDPKGRLSLLSLDAELCLSEVYAKVRSTRHPNRCEPLSPRGILGGGHPDRRSTQLSQATGHKHIQ